MNNLISMWDLKIYKDKTLNKKSLFLKEALRIIKNKALIHEEHFEDVICPFQLMLTLSEIVNNFNKKRKNKNATRRI